MNNYNPFFQLEIRYTPILDFKKHNRGMIAPYVRLASQIRIDNENSVNETIQLIFEDEKFVIFISWDRIFVRGQGDIKKHIIENSSIHNYFFNILNKIKNISSFDKIDRCLLLISTVLFKDDSPDLPNLLKTYFKDETLGILPDASDFAIVLEEKNERNEINCTFGPYNGIEDLIKRPTNPFFELPVELNKKGLYSEVKIFKKGANINFNDFKELVSNYERVYTNIWK